MPAVVHGQYSTILVDLFKLSLLFNPLTHIQDPHSLQTHNHKTNTGQYNSGLEEVKCHKLFLLMYNNKSVT